MCYIMHCVSIVHGGVLDHMQELKTNINILSINMMSAGSNHVNIYRLPNLTCLVGNFQRL